MLEESMYVLDIPGHHFQAFDEQNVGAKFYFWRSATDKYLGNRW